MTGRTRGSSAKSSSVDPARYIQEASVLRKPPPDIPDIQWQSFELDDATILNKDGKTLENALDVIVNGPFIIRGILKLETEDHELSTKQRAQLISKVKPSGRPLEIRESRQLSVGEMGLPEDIDPSKALGDPVLWMRGRAAWYEINPSPQYVVMYRKACRSIRLYYGILTIYESTCDSSGKVRPSRVEGKKSTTGIERLQDIFASYALKAGNGMTIEEVEQHCDEAAPLFIQWFLEAKDQLIWASTYFRRWMVQRHDDLLKKMSQTAEEIQKAASSTSFHELPTRKRTKSKTPVGLDEPVGAKSLTRDSSSSGAAAQRPQSKHPRSDVKQDQSPAQIPAQLVSAAPIANDQVMQNVPVGAQDALGSLVVALEHVHGQIYPKRALTTLAVVSKLYPTYKWPTFKNGKSGCHKVPIQEVLHYNASALLGRLEAQKWQGEFYDWLHEVSKTKLILEALKPSDFPYMVVPRNSKPFTPRTQQLDPVVASSARFDQSEVDDHDDSNEFETPRRPGRGIKTPARQGKSTLRPIASSYKRDFEDIESDSDEESPVAKRAHYDVDDDDKDAVKEQEALSSDEDDKIKLVIRADKLPSTAPQGRDGTWICEEEDCNFVVRGGDAESCQERIEAHFNEHQQQGERMQLAMTEGTRGHLPINHLLQKIQHLGERAEAREKKEQEEEYGMALPKPIKRRLLV